ncbi:MAG: lipid asymmetry maintenance ABC transporter permease subunit MlaE [Proteobacteria bacterium]|nr:lipid asymmetry maintenance ABC transporter permease subunit MlaE [Burkholderiales bacterium]
MARSTVPCRSTIQGPTTVPNSGSRHVLDNKWSAVSGLGRQAVEAFLRLGYATRVLGLTLMNSNVSARRPRLVVREVYFSGVLSLVIILVSGLFVGMVLGLQGYQTLKVYGAESSLGVLVAFSLLRELGPVITALLFASRAGSAVTAEIGLMKATEQLRAMEMMAVDPIARVVAPRFWAGVISTPLLTAMFTAMGIYGGYLVGVILLGVDQGSFWSQMQSAVDFREDVVNGLLKSIAFGIAISWIAVFEGYDAPPTAEGVSGATTRTVVTSALTILFLDYILTSLMFRGF